MNVNWPLIGCITGLAVGASAGIAIARDGSTCRFPESGLSSPSDRDARIAACKGDLAANPKDANAQLTLGRLEILLRDYPQAERDLSAAIALDPNRAQSWADRCNARLMQNNLVDAMPDCTRAIALDPSLPGPYFARGEMDVLHADYAGGLADIDRAIAATPQPPPSLFEYWRAKADYGLHRWSDTVADITRYAVRVADDPDAFRLRAGAQINLGNIPLAIDDIKRAKAIYVRTGDVERAARMDELIAKFSAPQ
jgi:tetratricopeptide (TPR) repeat protein